MINGHDPLAPEGQPTVTMEDAAGDFGFKIRYEHTKDGCAVCAWAKVGRQPEGLCLPLYVKADAEAELTPDYLLADPYLHAVFKPDGRVWTRGNQVFTGSLGMRKDFALRRHCFERAYKLMGLDGKAAWAQGQA